MKVHSLVVSGKVLKSMPIDDQIHVVQLSHLANSVSILQKLLAYTYKKSDIDLVWKANIAQGSLVGRMLGGVIVEGWKVLGPFLSSTRGREVAPKFSDKGQKYMKSLVSYLGKPNPIKKLRNKFAFHFDRKAIENELELVADNRAYHLYLGAHQGNSLFYLAEEIVGDAMINVVGSMKDEEDARTVLTQIYEDLVYLARWMLQVTHEIVALITLQHMPGTTMSDLEEIEVPDGPRIDEVSVPYFTTDGSESASN